MSELDPTTQTELEAAAFRRLTKHLRERPQLQNIDLMNMAGFCRNCLSNWLKDAADERGLSIDKESLRTHVYGMPYEDWKQLHQKPATDEQLKSFAQSPAAQHKA